MTDLDRLREQRSRASEADDVVDRLAYRGPAPDRVHIGQVYDGGAIPTAVPRVYLTRPMLIGTSESEGAILSPLVDGAASVPVLCLGPGVPVAGDYLVAHEVGGKWVSQTRRTGSGSSVPTVTVACCPDPIPTVLCAQLPDGAVIEMAYQVDIGGIPGETGWIGYHTKAAIGFHADHYDQYEGGPFDNPDVTSELVTEDATFAWFLRCSASGWVLTVAYAKIAPWPSGIGDAVLAGIGTVRGLLTHSTGTIGLLMSVTEIYTYSTLSVTLAVNCGTATFTNVPTVSIGWENLTTSESGYYYNGDFTISP